MTTEVIAPGELHIHAFKWGAARVAETSVLPAKSEDLRRAIEPTTTLEPGTWILKDRTESIAGKEYPESATANRTLVFPLSVLNEGNELHVLRQGRGYRLDHQIGCHYSTNSHCIGKFDLKGVK